MYRLYEKDPSLNISTHWKIFNLFVKIFKIDTIKNHLSTRYYYYFFGNEYIQTFFLSFIFHDSEIEIV